MPKTRQDKYRQIIKRIVDEAFTNNQLYHLAKTCNPDTPDNEIPLHILEDIHGECERRANGIKRTITRRQKRIAINEIAYGFDDCSTELMLDAAHRTIMFMPSQTILEESYQTEEDE